MLNWPANVHRILHTQDSVCERHGDGGGAAMGGAKGWERFISTNYGGWKPREGIQGKTENFIGLHGSQKHKKAL